MSQLIATAASIFRIDRPSFTASGEPADDRIDSTIEAINALYSIPEIAQLFTGSSLNLGTTGIITVGLDSSHGGAYNAQGPGYPSYLGLSDTEYSGGAELLTVNGATYHVSLAAAILHEIVHLFYPVPGPSIMYAEEPVVFLTNYFQTRYLGFPERIGHFRGPANQQVSVSALEGLHDFTLLSSSFSGGSYSFIFSSASSLLTKTYYGQDAQSDHRIAYTLSSESPLLTAEGNHLGTELASLMPGVLVVDPASKISEVFSINDDLSNVMTALTSDTLGPSNGWASSFMSSYGQLVPTDYLGLSAERFEDRIGNTFYNIQGVVAHGAFNTANGPDSIIQEAFSDASTLLLGAGGIAHLDGVDGQFALLNSVDVLTGHEGDDVLIAGSGQHVGLQNSLNGGVGNDFLLGDLSPDGAPSLLNGGAGNDIFVSAHGHDIITGGDGNRDLLSYAHSDSGVTIDLDHPITLAGGDASGTSVSYGQGHGGDAEGDQYNGLEVFVGTSFNDSFTGDSSRSGDIDPGDTSFLDGISDRTMFIGGGGDDSFYLHSGDIAYGGPGSDSFYLSFDSSSQEVSNVAILGLDPFDKIYVDGSLYTGRIQHSELKQYYHSDASEYGPEMNLFTPSVTSDESVFHPIDFQYENGTFGTFTATSGARGDYISEQVSDTTQQLTGDAYLFLYDATGQSEKTLTVWLTGYQAGDAGISYQSDYFPDLDQRNIDSPKAQTDGLNLSNFLSSTGDYLTVSHLQTALFDFSHLSPLI